jgi:hypothetical protein
MEAMHVTPQGAVWEEFCVAVKEGGGGVYERSVAGSADFAAALASTTVV